MKNINFIANPRVSIEEFKRHMEKVKKLRTTIGLGWQMYNCFIYGAMYPERSLFYEQIKNEKTLSSECKMLFGKYFEDEERFTKWLKNFLFLPEDFTSRVETFFKTIDNNGAVLPSSRNEMKKLLCDIEEKVETPSYSINDLEHEVYERCLEFLKYAFEVAPIMSYCMANFSDVSELRAIAVMFEGRALNANLVIPEGGELLGNSYLIALFPSTERALMVYEYLRSSIEGGTPLPGIMRYLISPEGKQIPEGNFLKVKKVSQLKP